MEVSLQINSISNRFGEMLQFNHKAKNSGHKITISCQAANTMQTGRTTNFYELLSLDCSKFVGPDEIKKAYTYKALKFHPDACPPSTKEESTRRFIELRMAYETLSNPISRKMYDHELTLVDAEERRRHGMSCCMANRRGVERFPREVWERQLNELKKRSRQKMEKTIDNKK